MEWNRIETKWNEMARRLQNMAPAAGSGAAAGGLSGAQDAVSVPEPKTAPHVRATDKAQFSVRVTA